MTARKNKMMSILYPIDKKRELSVGTSPTPGTKMVQSYLNGVGSQSRLINTSNHGGESLPIIGSSMMMMSKPQVFTSPNKEDDN